LITASPDITKGYDGLFVSLAIWIDEIIVGSRKIKKEIINQCLQANLKSDKIPNFEDVVVVLIICVGIGDKSIENRVKSNI
jgi:hypothetical protein